MSKKSSKTKKKRANGEGSFYQLEDKRWVHQITLGRKEDGKPNRKSFTGLTKEACLEKKRAYIKAQELVQANEQEYAAHAAEAMRDGHTIEAEVKFCDAFLPWLQLYKAPPATKATTYGSYMDTYHTHLLPAFGKMALHEITPDVVQEYYQRQQKDGARKDGRPGGLSAKTIRNHHMLIKDFFEYAKRKFKLAENPTYGTNRPEVVTPPRRFLSAEEMEIFIAEVMRETQRVAILFALFTGVRKGELLALEITDINLHTQSFRIERNITRVRTDIIEPDNLNIRVLDWKPENKTQLIIQNTPKTKSSCRDVPMSDALCELVLKHLFYLKHSGWPNPQNLLFPSKVGTHIDPKSFEIRLTAVSKRCEIKKVNPHALRHTFATRLVDENVPLPIIKDILGHSSIQTTQLYTQKNTELEREAITGITNCLNVNSVVNAPRLNGTKKRMKFADIKLPDFAEPNTAV